jgi:hypothetical protein
MDPAVTARMTRVSTLVKVPHVFECSSPSKRMPSRSAPLSTRRQASRDRNQARLDAGDVTRQQLAHENTAPGKEPPLLVRMGRNRNVI